MKCHVARIMVVPTWMFTIGPNMFRWKGYLGVDYSEANGSFQFLNFFCICTVAPK